MTRKHTPTNYERELIRNIQQGTAFVDLATGRVTSVFDDSTMTGEEYIGNLRRKLIPDRKRLEREAREKRGDL